MKLHKLIPEYLHKKILKNFINYILTKKRPKLTLIMKKFIYETRIYK